MGVAVALGVAIWAIGLPGAAALPAVALGSKWVLLVERALVVFLGLLVAIVALVRSFSGELPIKFGQGSVEWQTVEKAKDETVEVLENLARAIDRERTEREALAQEVERIRQAG